MLGVRLLGGIRVARDGVSVDLSPRAVGLLVRLALAGAPVGRDQLLIDLWGDDVDPARVRSLETLISSIRRQAVGPDGLRFAHDAYHLTVPVELDIALVLTTARLLDEGRASAETVAGAVLAADQGSAPIRSLGQGRWIDQLEAEVEAAVAQVRAADRGAVVPSLRYAELGGRHLAYQVQPGTGTPVVLLGGLVTHCEGMWSAPGFGSWVEAVIGGRPLVMLDKRGCGLSDPAGGVPTDADLADDVLAVLDAAGIERCLLVAAAEAGMFGPHVAARRPEAVAGMVFINAVARMFEADDYPHGLPERVARDFGHSVRQTWARDDVGLRLAAPSRAANPDLQQWAARYQRLAATPGSVWELALYSAEGDGRQAAAALDCPVLVVQSRHSTYFRPSSAQWLPPPSPASSTRSTRPARWPAIERSLSGRF